MCSLGTPEVSRTPSTFPGAQFNFLDLLHESIEKLVSLIAMQLPG